MHDFAYDEFTIDICLKKNKKIKTSREKYFKQIFKNKMNEQKKINQKS